MPSWSNGIVIAVVSWLLHHRSTEKAKRRLDAVVFRPRLATRMAFYLGLPFYITGAVGALFEIPGNRQWGIFAGFLGFVAVTLFCWPGNIIVDSRGVRQIWLGMCKRRIEWSQIKSAAYLEGDNYVVIKSADGRALRTSSVHIDPEGLVNELKWHVRVDVSKVRYV
jgi:hypothetical protein